MKSSFSVFDENALEYDDWFEMHSIPYQSELSALKQAISPGKTGIEIGVGTGRFAQVLDIKYGVEPSENMARMAEKKGIKVLRAVAENLPVDSNSFDFALMVTTVCFLNNIPKAFSEVYRILKPQGEVILAIIDQNSEIGKKYEKEKNTNLFYRDAHFHSTEEITKLIKHAGFKNLKYWQTLFKNNSEKIEQPREGFGEGSFVVIKATKTTTQQEENK
ncbi:MAG TPA: class I SAM-dependent methyltransferase [Bacteroidales bacterium]|nr:class I SAM-dependent methyltransferase [Bacteroidales bacterium]